MSDSVTIRSWRWNLTELTRPAWTVGVVCIVGVGIWFEAVSPGSSVVVWLIGGLLLIDVLAVLAMAVRSCVTVSAAGLSVGGLRSTVCIPYGQISGLGLGASSWWSRPVLVVRTRDAWVVVAALPDFLADQLLDALPLLDDEQRAEISFLARLHWTWGTWRVDVQ